MKISDPIRNTPAVSNETLPAAGCFVIITVHIPYSGINISESWILYSYQ